MQHGIKLIIAGVYEEKFRMSTGFGRNINFLGADETNLKDYRLICQGNSISKSKMILRRRGGGDEAYCIYVEEADNNANKNSALI
jgi:hypothetical protein